MSKLEELIQRLCPNGVEYKTFDNICHLITDGSHSSPEGVKHGHPMLSVKDMGTNDFIFSNCKLISEEDYDSLVRNGCRPKKNDVLVAKDGSMLKYIFSVETDVEYVILSSIAILRPKTDIVHPKYIVHYLRHSAVREKIIRENSSKGGVPRIILKNFKRIEIPLPPLPVQEEIVRILDAFMSHAAELQAELQARREQYEYYRNKLLSFEDDSSVEWLPISDIGRRNKGMPITAAFMKKIENKDGDIHVFAAGNNNIMAFRKDLPGDNLIEGPAILVKSRGNIGFEFVNRTFTHKNELWSYTIKGDVNSKYVFYYLSNHIQYFSK